MRKEKLKELKQYIEELRTIKMLANSMFKRPFITVEQMTCLLNNGKIIVREQIFKNGQNGSAAIILPITNNNNVLLVVEPRVFTKQTVSVELPAGYIETGENPTLAAIRELKEETGYQTNKLIKIASYYQDQGCSSAFNHSFIAYECEKISEQKLDADEYIRYFECTYQEALELVDMGYINDANSVLTLEKAKQYIRENHMYEQL